MQSPPRGQAGNAKESSIAAKNCKSLKEFKKAQSFFRVRALS